MTMSPTARRGWIVVATTFVTMGLTYGVWYCYAVFLVAFLREFGWSRTVVAGAFSTAALVQGFACPLIGWAASRFGPRRVIVAGGSLLALGLLFAAETTRPWHLYLSFGGAVAIGIASSGFIPSVLLVSDWFPSRVGTSLGIASAGIGFGMAALQPAAQYLIEETGLRWTFRILAVLVAAWIIPATLWLIRDPPRQPRASIAEAAAGGAPRSPGSHWTLATAFRTWRFWGVLGVFLAGNSVTQMLLVHQVAFLVDHGVPALTAASVGSVVGVTSILAKMGWGALSDRAGRELAYVLAFACVLGSVGALALSGVLPETPLPYLYGVLIGVGYAVIAPLTPAIVRDLFGGARFSTIFGTLHVGNSLGSALGAWSAGRIHDLTGSYAWALVLGACLAVAAPLLVILVAPRRPLPPPARFDSDRR